MSARSAVTSIAAGRRQLALSVSIRQIPWSSGRSGMQRARSWRLSTCLQSTPKLSETVADLAINGSANRPQTASVGLRCGQQWWSGCLARRKNTVKRSLTFDPRRLASFVPKPTSDVDCQGCGMPDLGSIVHRCPLASAADGGDRYSLGYSVLVHAGTRLVARPSDP